MGKLKSAIEKSKMLRKIVNSAKENRLIYIMGCLLVSKKVRSVYWNYIFTRKKMLDALLGYGSLPRNLYIEGTNICNAGCIFCAYDKLKRPKTTMSMELFKDIIDQYITIGGKAIGFTPIVGDPLLDKFLFDRIDYLDRKDQIKNIQFYTNGIASSEDKVDRILEYKNTIINFNISFGGYDRNTFKTIMGVDKFDVVKRNILYLLARLEKKPNPNVIVKIDFRCPEERASGLLFRRLKECIESGLIRHDSLCGVFDNFGGLIEEKTLEQYGLRLKFGTPKLGPCDILFRKPIVLADGRVNACAERDLEASLIIGDVTKQPLREILDGPQRNDLIELFYSNNLPKVCRECSVYQSIYDNRSKIWKKDLNWVA